MSVIPALVPLCRGSVRNLSDDFKEGFPQAPDRPEQALEVERRIIPIARRSISTLIQYQGIGDLYCIYAVTQRDGVGFNLAFIPPTFKTPHKKDFDAAYMRELFAFGYRMAEAGYSWYTEPPVFVSRDEDASITPR